MSDGLECWNASEHREHRGSGLEILGGGAAAAALSGGGGAGGSRFDIADCVAVGLLAGFDSSAQIFFLLGDGGAAALVEIGGRLLEIVRALADVFRAILGAALDVVGAFARFIGQERARFLARAGGPEQTSCYPNTEAEKKISEAAFFFHCEISFVFPNTKTVRFNDNL